MEAMKQIVRTPANHEIRIAIPPDVQKDEPIEVIVIMRKKDAFKQKIRLLQSAMQNEVFLRDLQEVAQDFESFDLLEWEHEI